MAWECIASHATVRDIMNDAGLAKLGDSLVNLCYSLAKSIVLGCPTGEKVKDSVLARAIRASAVYGEIGHRTDQGGAADAYEAIMAWLWLSRKTTIESVVDLLTKQLSPDRTKSQKKSDESAVHAFRYLLEQFLAQLPVFSVTVEENGDESLMVSKP